jgi:hypothetical protein
MDRSAKFQPTSQLGSFAWAQTDRQTDGPIRFRGPHTHMPRDALSACLVLRPLRRPHGFPFFLRCRRRVSLMNLSPCMWGYPSIGLSFHWATAHTWSTQMPLVSAVLSGRVATACVASRQTDRFHSCALYQKRKTSKSSRCQQETASQTTSPYATNPQWVFGVT